MNVNGSLRDFCPAGANYIGVDLETGNGVDVVVDDPTQLPFVAESFDVILSSSCFEHDKLFWLTFLELCRLLRPGGVIYISAPSNGMFHRYPLDCWRFYPDAGDALAQWATRNGQEIRLLESFVGGRKADMWNDCVMIFAKGGDGLPQLYDKLPFPAWNVRGAALPEILFPAADSEDMMLLRALRRQLAASEERTLQLALARASSDRCSCCWLCGHQDPAAQPAPACPRCGAAPPVMALARAIASFCGRLEPLAKLVRETPPPARILDLSRHPILAATLARLPNYRTTTATEAASLEAGSCDLILGGGADALSEGCRLLRPGGALIIAGEGLPPWTDPAAAGFARMSIDRWDGGPAWAATAWKSATVDEAPPPAETPAAPAVAQVTGKTFLHVGCGPQSKTVTPFNSPAWRELRLDIDPAVEPDYLCSMLDMGVVATDSVDAIYSSHNIEHLMAHQVQQALSEFHRVLKPQGFLILTCPDLQSAAAMIAEDRLDQAAYVSPGGPITALDILFGYGPLLENGNSFMAHRTGFTLATLTRALEAAGFASVHGLRREKSFDLWMLAGKAPLTEAERQELVKWHFPI